MIKLSELIKYYESIEIDADMKLFFSESTYCSAISRLEDVLEAVGDVTMEKEYFIAFMKMPYAPKFETHMDYMKKIRILYELCKDIKITTDDLSYLFACYQEGPYTLMFKEIKELIISGKFMDEIYFLCQKAYDIARDEAAKLDYLKDEYGEDFIEEIQKIVVEKCLSVDKVLEILPSKDLIDSSRVDIPGLHYSILSGEDLVTRRLRYLEVEKDYQETPLDYRIKLGYCSHGDTIFTSFTKGEYEEDLRSKKILIKTK